MAVTITERVEKALAKGTMTALEIANATGLRPTQVSGALTSLKSQGKAEQVGNARWDLTWAGDLTRQLQAEPANNGFKPGMLFEAVGFLADRTMLVRQVETHTVYAIAPVVRHDV